VDFLSKLLGDLVCFVNLRLDLLRHVVDERLVVLLTFKLLLFVKESLLLQLDLSSVLGLLISHLLFDELKLLLCALELFVLDLEVVICLIAFIHDLLQAFCHFDFFRLNSDLFTLDLVLFFTFLLLKHSFRIPHLLHHCCLLCLESSVVLLFSILL